MGAVVILATVVAVSTVGCSDYEDGMLCGRLHGEVNGLSVVVLANQVHTEVAPTWANLLTVGVTDGTDATRADMAEAMVENRDEFESIVNGAEGDLHDALEYLGPLASDPDLGRAEADAPETTAAIEALPACGLA